MLTAGANNIIIITQIALNVDRCNFDAVDKVLIICKMAVIIVN